NTVLSFKDLQIKKNFTHYYPIQLEKNIINNIRAGNKAQALIYLEELKREINSAKDLSYQNIYRIYYRLVDALLDLLNENNTSLDDVFGNNFNIYHELSRRETVDTIHQWIGQLIGQIITFFETDTTNNHYIETVIEFMQQHYAADLSLDHIA